MAKKGPIGKVEAFYIDNNYKIMDIAQLACDLDRTIVSIEKYIKENHSRKSSTMPIGEQFARQKGVTIMTENASTLSDSKRVKKNIRSSCVIKIKKDNE